MIAVDEPVSIDAAIDVSALGKTVRDALRRSRSPVPHPNPGDWPAITDQFLRATGVKTWATFVRGAVLTTVESDASEIVFQPHENCGPRKAFQPMGLPSFRVDATAPDAEIGGAARRALDVASSSAAQTES